MSELKSIVEALIFASPEPLTVKTLTKLLDTEPKEDIVAAIEELKAEYQRQGGLTLVEVAGGYQIVTRAELHEWVRRLFHERTTQKLSVAALETLAVVAYMGPCSRPEIARLRGVAVDSVVAGLAERGLIAEAGREPLGAVRYRVTPLFERVFGLEDLAALPRLEDLGGDAEELRGRLEALAERRPA